MEKHSIGKTIACLRKEKGWTQVELAEKLNVSDKAISKWESEAGLPEISQLPIMAELFNVTIDFLMTGKAPDKEIITMSKAELCTKNDDVSLAEDVKDLPKDENGKNIVDYILKYQSFNVFKKLCEIDSKFINRFKILDAINLTIMSNSLYLLSGKVFQMGNYRFTFEDENEIKSLLPVEDKDYFQNQLDKFACMLPRSFFEMLVTDKRINEETMDILLSNQRGREYVWYHAFPYLIEEAYKNSNKVLFEKLLCISKRNNDAAYQIEVTRYYAGGYNYTLNYFYIAEKGGRNGYGIVRILESTIKLALNKGDFDLVNKFNEINSEANEFFTQKLHMSDNGSSKCYVASEDEIRVAKLKLDKSVSEYEVQAQAAIHNGIISIKELEGIKDFATIKKALYEYPIHPAELLYKWYQENNLKQLFEFVVDNDMRDFAKAIIENDHKCIEDNIIGSWTKENDPYYCLKRFYINSSELYVGKNDFRSKFNRLRQRNYHYQVTLQEIFNFLSDVRQRIINELSNKFNKENVVGELTRDYFCCELSKGNRDLVIIKLCVRMEAILKCDGYIGDFAEMLDKYCNEKLTWSEDDGWGYFYNKSDEKIINLLHKLRKIRNSLVHSEKTDESMSEDEIKQCIDYICSL